MAELPALELGAPWTLDDLDKIARAEARLVLPQGARNRVLAARRHVDRIVGAAEGAPSVYGVNTGFGALAETRIAHDQLRALQHNLLRSHACGVGPELPVRVVRAMMALRAHTLSLGHSGVRCELIGQLIRLLDAEIYPCIPAQGSVGASGDLAPLAHLGLALVGEGEVWHRGQRKSAQAALEAESIPALRLEAKEGLSLINGTQMMVAVGALAVLEGQRLCQTADVVGAMSLDALMGSKKPFDTRIHEVRPHPGQAASAANLRALLGESEIMLSHQDCPKVQDPYSLRCMPQVHGASRDALAWSQSVLEREMASVTDNPIVFLNGERGELISGGNFHGQPVALAMDTAAMAIAELANVAERRLEQLVNPAMSSGLPPFLAPRTGIDSGFMMAQVTAAALVSENKVLCHPSSTDSIPSSAGKEDHVSMGSIAARKAAQVVEHVRTVLAIEAMVAAQGLDARLPLKGGRGVMAAHEALRTRIPTLAEDRTLHRDIEAATVLLTEGLLVGKAAEAVGELR